MIEYAEHFPHNEDEDVKIVPLRNSNIVMNRDLRMACEQNSCGHYGKNWMCPPDVGDIDELIKKIRSCGDGLLIQSVCKIEDPFDYEGMMAGAEQHRKAFNTLLDIIRKHSDMPLLPLNAGQCTVCENCASKLNEPCRFPDKAIASVESHGMDVNGTLGNVGLDYNNGPNTVSYVGIILNKKQIR